MSNIFTSTYSYPGVIPGTIQTNTLNAAAMGGNTTVGSFQGGNFGTWTTTGSTTANITYYPTLELKTCRTCDHAHIEGQKGCIVRQGFGIEIAQCVCTEYLPKDNLEYIEHMYNKQKTKE